ncbi:hypothetical protein QJQ45_008395 [Haematococcus lacustris]|nr:hypothetical protein QJQ45_008395 [Haematococcus lacustris]
MAFIAMDDGPASPAQPRPTPPHASCNASGNAARLELLDSWLKPEYGSELPHLQVVAQRVLSIPPTSAATERLFKEQVALLVQQRMAEKAKPQVLLRASTPSQAQALNWLLAGPHPPHHPSPSLLNSNQGAQLPWGSSLVSGAEPQTAALGARPQCLERGPGSMRAAMGMGAGGLGVGGVTQGLATSTLTGLFDGRLLGLSTPNQVVPEEGVDDGLCVICYDKPSSCVFLDCGHGGFCKACAYRIFVRPPNECPTCRQHIEQVVELEEVRPMGQVSKAPARCKVDIAATSSRLSLSSALPSAPSDFNLGDLLS